MQEIYPEIFQDVVKSAQVEFKIENDNFISLDKALDENYFGV